MNNFDDMPDSTDWCAGGCNSFKDTKEGLELYKILGTKLKHYEKEKNNDLDAN